MSIFDFSAPGVQDALAQVQNQIALTEQVNGELRRVLQPLVDGGWIGQGAEAFFQEMQQELAENDQLHNELLYFHGTLGQAMQVVIDTMQRIDNITQMIS